MRRHLKMFFLKTINLKRMSQNSQRRPIFIRITKKNSQTRIISSKSFRSIRVKSTSRMCRRRNLPKNQKRMKRKRSASLLVILKFPRIIQKQPQIKKKDWQRMWKRWSKRAEDGHRTKARSIRWFRRTTSKKRKDSWTNTSQILERRLKMMIRPRKW